jgi:hypothetical protein
MVARPFARIELPVGKGFQDRHRVLNPHLLATLAADFPFVGHTLHREQEPERPIELQAEQLESRHGLAFGFFLGSGFDAAFAAA